MNSEKLAHQIRLKCVEIASQTVGCHLGGSLSCSDILAVLFEVKVKNNPNIEIVLSKGHAAASYYSVLWATQQLQIDPAKHYGRADSFLTGHPNMKVPGVTFATGALGHGPSLGLGVAIARKLRNQTDPVYVIVGDGELQEGSCWETFQVASSKGICNYTVIIDKNGGQNDGMVADISPLGDLAQKFSAFGFHTTQVNGHNHNELQSALNQSSKNKPQALIAETIKGFGIKALMNNPKSHYVAISTARAETWMKELNDVITT